MEVQPFRIPLKSRVEIKDEVTEVYPLARAYMQGWIRDHRHDRLGYPEVWIEWDKKHWAYNGEKDGWTFESHFNLVEDKSMADSNEADDLLARLRKAVEALEGDPSRGAEESKPSAPEDLIGASEPELPSYEEHLTDALSAATEAEAFFLIALRPVDIHGRHGYSAEVYQSYREDPKSLLLLGTQISALGATLHEHCALELDQKDRDERRGTSERG